MINWPMITALAAVAGLVAGGLGWFVRATIRSEFLSLEAKIRAWIDYDIRAIEKRLDRLESERRIPCP